MRIILIAWPVPSRKKPTNFAGGTPMDHKSLTKKQRLVLDAFERREEPMSAHQAWQATGIDSMGHATVYPAIFRYLRTDIRREALAPPRLKNENHSH